MTTCNHSKIVCPNHEGSFDCTPFCRLCEGDCEFCIVCEPLSNEDWEAYYKPIKNHITNDDSVSFETYGEEVNFVASQDPHYVWTEVDGDNGVYIVNGMAYANRIQYYVTEVPWQEDEDICITICEYVVCSCYNPDDEETEPDEDCQQCFGDGTYTDWKN